MTFPDPLSVALLECRDGRVVRASAALATWIGVDAPEGLEGRCPDDWLRDLGDGLPDWSAGELPAAAAPCVECGLRPDRGPARRVFARPLGGGCWELADRTALRRLEEELQELGSRLVRAQHALEAERQRGLRERARQEDLLTVVSHELRTPLTVIAGFLRLLHREEAGALNAEQRRFVEECQRSMKRLDAFVADLLAADRAGTGIDEASLGEASLVRTIEGVAAFVKPLLEEGGHRLVLELARDAGRARFDPARVEQVLVNLIGNALSHGAPGGEVTVTTRRLEAAGLGWVEVAVSDEGPGIPPEAREHVFEPYARLDAQGGGLGLGLAICRQLVEAHGGRILAGDAPGGGARIAFTLPAAAEPA